MDSVFAWWIGEGEEDRELMEHVRRELARTFGRPVFLWESPERPFHAYDAKRKQWQTAPILKWLLEEGPENGKVLGVTDRDLFIPILTYVFGEAQLGGRAAVRASFAPKMPASTPSNLEVHRALGMRASLNVRGKRRPKKVVSCRGQP